MNQEKKKFYYSLLFPAIFVAVIWIVKIAETILDSSFAEYGVYPQETGGLIGIITGPLIHGDFEHLAANTVPILVLGTGLFYFYRPIAFNVFVLIYILSGLMLWIGGRPAFHIGASGLIYGLAAFLFLSGLLRKYVRLMAISLLIVFLYGGLIWGVLPIDQRISWEGHLFGGITGLAIALYYKDRGPQRKKYEWEIEEELEEKGEKWDEYDWEIYYHYDQKRKRSDEDE
jgi:membrane associated rhomboid family serine protease